MKLLQICLIYQNYIRSVTDINNTASQNSQNYKRNHRPRNKRRMSAVILDGWSMDPELLVATSDNPKAQIQVSEAAWVKVERARQVIENIVTSGRTVYGINTGFGKFATTRIEPKDVSLLQTNLIRSHCAGTGDPLPPNRARRVLLLRINVLAKGHSGIRPATLRTLVAMYNAGCVPFIPEKGTVGASGDLAPLSHVALNVLGEGKMSTLNDPVWRPAGEVLRSLQISPVLLAAKEGLALINGTQFITSLGCEALVRARNIARQADIVAAVTMEGLDCTKVAMYPRIHAVRHHQGQREVAARILSMLDSDAHPSEIARSREFDRVQDAYSIRCAPQVHGQVSDTMRYVHHILTMECNCATDNPLVFPDAPEDEQIISGGNFHGEYPAKMMDILGLTVHELANISERRIERLNNPHLSHLPAFLTERGGLNSGFMISHCTAAALVSENKVLCHPASIDSISTSAAQEDHVSMGGFAARKALMIVENVEMVLAIELMCAVQAIEFHRPKKTTAPLERVVSLVRSVVPTWIDDRNVSIDQERLVSLLRNNKVWEAVAQDLAPHLHIPLDSAGVRAKL